MVEFEQSTYSITLLVQNWCLTGKWKQKSPTFGLGKEDTKELVNHLLHMDWDEWQ